MPFIPRLLTWLAPILLLGAATTTTSPPDAPQAVLSPLTISLPDARESWSPDAERAAEDAFREVEWIRMAAEHEQAQIAAAQVTEVARWEPLARCETNLDWKMDGPVHTGGVGFAVSTWRAFGGTEFAPTAGQATPYEQVIVATRVRDAVGPGAWSSCAPFVPTG